MGTRFSMHAMILATTVDAFTKFCTCADADTTDESHDQVLAEVLKDEYEPCQTLRARWLSDIADIDALGERTFDLLSDISNSYHFFSAFLQASVEHGLDQEFADEMALRMSYPAYGDIENKQVRLWCTSLDFRARVLAAVLKWLMDEE